MGEINKKYNISKDINDLKKNGVSQENINTAVNNSQNTNNQRKNTKESD